jgi:hypothetical protein
VVSARNRSVRSTFAFTALASSASFNPSTAAVLHRVVKFNQRGKMTTVRDAAISGKAW